MIENLTSKELREQHYDFWKRRYDLAETVRPLNMVLDQLGLESSSIDYVLLQHYASTLAGNNPIPIPGVANSSVEPNELLNQLVKATGIVEVARKLLVRKYLEQLYIANYSADEDDRKLAYIEMEVLSIAEGYSQAMDLILREGEDALATYFEEPTEIGEMKAYLCEKLESSAMQKQKELKGAISQQAIDNWASCGDQDDALQQVAKNYTLSFIDIQRATLYDDVRDAFNKGIEKIQSVTPANTPWWKVGSSDLRTSMPSNQDVNGYTVVVRAYHPKAGIEGNVSIIAGTDDLGGSIPKDDPTAYEVTLQLPSDATKPKTYDLTAYNLCGPSKLTVSLTP